MEKWEKQAIVKLHRDDDIGGGGRHLKLARHDAVRRPPSALLRLDIEFKHGGFEEKAVKLIEKYCKPEKTMVSGFDITSLNKVHELSPKLQLGYIYNRTQDEVSRHHGPVDIVIPQFRLASRQLIEEVHDEGLKVWAWTVNEESEIKRLLTLGVDGLITDYPQRVKAALSR